MLDFFWLEESGSVLWSDAQDDGLMIKCGICKLWQHAICFGFLDEEAVPDLHVCRVCSKVTLTTNSHKQNHKSDCITNLILLAFVEFLWSTPLYRSSPCQNVQH